MMIAVILHLKLLGGRSRFKWIYDGDWDDGVDGDDNHDDNHDHHLDGDADDNDNDFYNADGDAASDDNDCAAYAHDDH